MRFNIIWLLTKNNLRGSFNQNRNASKRKKQSSSLLVLGIVFLLLSAFYNFSIVLAFQQMDMLNQYLPMVIGLSALLTFVFTLFKYESTIFGTKDYELLESMPITKKAFHCPLFMAEEE